MDERTVTQQIIKLLERGKTSGEVISMGYKPRTVFSVQRKWRRKKEQPVEQSHRRQIGAAVADPHDRDASHEVTDRSVPSYFSSKGLKAQVKVIPIDLDSRLLVLYDMDKALFPQYAGSFGKWISDVVIGYHKQNAHKLQLSRLFHQ